MEIYSDEMHRLFDGLGIEANLYESSEPVRVQSRVRGLTPEQRQQVEALSTERGYRRFVAERMAL